MDNKPATRKFTVQEKVPDRYKYQPKLKALNDGGSVDTFDRIVSNRRKVASVTPQDEGGRLLASAANPAVTRPIGVNPKIEEGENFHRSTDAINQNRSPKYKREQEQQRRFTKKRMDDSSDQFLDLQPNIALGLNEKPLSIKRGANSQIRTPAVNKILAERHRKE